MLCHLSIRNAVLIERLDIAFSSGLTVLTGETGAGKSVLLDTLSLALGGRGDSEMIRPGGETLTTTATFSPPRDHPVRPLLEDAGISLPEGEDLILRRQISKKGRSRAWIADEPVSIKTLKAAGETLVEIHGQFESHALLNPATHTGVLDTCGDLSHETRAVADAWMRWKISARSLADAEENLAASRAEEDFLRESLEELETLAPEEREAAELAEKRRFLMNAGKIAENVNLAMEALTGRQDAAEPLRTAQGLLSRVEQMAPGRFEEVQEGLDRAVVEINEATTLLESVATDIDADPRAAETVEERLFALRKAARKHGVNEDDLPGVQQELSQKLAALDAGNLDMERLEAEEKDARAAYLSAAGILHEERKKTAGDLDRRVMAELPPLKLDGARFETAVTRLEETQAGPRGMDSVRFCVATTPETAPAPLHKIASGGELARLMLAMKVILADTLSPPTLIFDEVDSGVGGATAAAVGDRLARLSRSHQTLVVTHSPQVAARGATHLNVIKKKTGETLRTEIIPISAAERTEEIARMLADETVTREARAAAVKLLEAGDGTE